VSTIVTMLSLYEVLVLVLVLVLPFVLLVWIALL
jgi:hypothetical protein